jgi:outer membrane protein TolC
MMRVRDKPVRAEQTTMIRSLRRSLAGAVLVVGVPAALSAQTTVTMDDAMALARTDTPSARAMSAGVAEAIARVAQARARLLPRVDITESVQRGNEPVFVFSTLLSQRRFMPANFDVQNLNDPAAETNIRTAVAMTQPVYDAAAARGVRSAELQRDLATVDQRRGTQDLALAAARSFVQVLRLEAAERASVAAVAAAESDLERTQQRRDVGLVTDADVLALEVHLADSRQRQIATSGDLVVARLELAEALGLPLDQPVVLVKPSPAAAPADMASLTRQALDARPERHQAEIQIQLAENERRLAQAAFLPRVGIDTAWEFNGSRWSTQRSGWIVGARVELNVFNGLADRARVSAARQAEARTAADRDRIERRIEVDVRTAVTRVTAAQARETAGRASLAQARDSQRIVRDRYDAGLATITDVLRAAEAVFDAEARATAAEMDTILETVALNRAAGRL